MKKALVFGGTGLIGSAIVKKLAPKVDLVTIVSLNTEVDKQEFKQLAEEFSNIEHITGNVFLPTKYKDKSINEILKTQELLNDFLKIVYLKHTPEELFLYKVITQTQPDIIVDAVNSATFLSYTRNEDLVKSYLQGENVEIKGLLATLPTPRLIHYFDCLYKALKDTPSIKTFLKIGTTGTGGMGFNIPYTHGESKPSFQLLEKAAVSGAYTSLLYLLSQTFGMPQIKEVKPAALVGLKKVDFAPIRVNAEKKLKVVEFSEVKTFDLNKIKKLEYEDLSLTLPRKEFRAVFVDTGENGQFALEEFRTISNERQMGFITKEEIASVVVQEIDGKNTGKNIIRSFQKAVLGPSSKGQKQRKIVIKQIEALVKKIGQPSLAFEILGPPRLAKLIFEAYLMEKYIGFDNAKSLQSFGSDINQQDIKLVVSTGIPIVLDNNTLLVGLKPKTPVSGEEVSQKKIDEWANDGWVDLRRKNIQKWAKRLSDYGKLNMDFKIGDITAWIFEVEDGGFRS